jgi:YfiH family protein
VSFRLDSDGILRLEAWRDIPWLLHGFTTRRTGDFGNGTPDGESLRRIQANGMQLRTVRQIHSNQVRLLSRDGSDSWQRPEGDALVTDLAGQVLGVRTADCLPLLLVDRERRAVASVHAGWRGTQQRIAASAAEAMRAHFGSEPESLEVAIGPGIAACCFEVGPEVAEQFHPSLVVAPRAGLESPEKARPHVDLVEANRRQLLEQGISGRKLWSAGRCTVCGGDFFSYRRDKETARMLAFVGIKADTEPRA